MNCREIYLDRRLTIPSQSAFPFEGACGALESFWGPKVKLGYQIVEIEGSEGLREVTGSLEATAVAQEQR